MTSVELKTVVQGMATSVYNKLKLEYVLGIATCSPMYKKAIELGELYELKAIKSTPLVEARITKIHNMFSPAQLEKMHQIIEFNMRTNESDPSATTIENPQIQPS